MGIAAGAWAGAMVLKWIRWTLAALDPWYEYLRKLIYFPSCILNNGAHELKKLEERLYVLP